ncbi:MAG: hypothetical protein CRN43_20035 [Candidatus Nephrothrix sp. EaCA]|nr:MAG: hypothetical protein CRN43_20035 [Candidatus Nephrothrix sp. EaCA]
MSKMDDLSCNLVIFFCDMRLFLRQIIKKSIVLIKKSISNKKQGNTFAVRNLYPFCPFNKSYLKS